MPHLNPKTSKRQHGSVVLKGNLAHEAQVDGDAHPEERRHRVEEVGRVLEHDHVRANRAVEEAGRHERERVQHKPDVDLSMGARAIRSQAPGLRL